MVSHLFLLFMGILRIHTCNDQLPVGRALHWYRRGHDCQARQNVQLEPRARGNLQSVLVLYLRAISLLLELTEGKDINFSSLFPCS